MLTKEIFGTEFEKMLYSISGHCFEESSIQDKYLALGTLVKIYSGRRWHATRRKQEVSGEKSVYYFSMEYLTGKFLRKNLEYLGYYDMVETYFEERHVCMADLLDAEHEPGLGNGGLGRLAAAFLDSLSSLSMPGHGYGIRYEKGLFQQVIDNGGQREKPDSWLVEDNIWEQKMYQERLTVRYGGRILYIPTENNKYTFKHVDYQTVYAIPYDIPVLGYQNDHVNTLRLWGAESCEDINLVEFGKGNLCGAFEQINYVKSISQVLYPDDTNLEGKRLRLRQEYFLVSASLQDILRNQIKLQRKVTDLALYVAIHINDTHPTMAIPELMRILMDEHNLEWDVAWKITVDCCAFTNHTLLAEAMEKWDVGLFRELLPRIWQITEEINNRFLRELKENQGITDSALLDRLSIIRQNTVHMVNLSIVGTHSINGVAKLHSDLLKEKELNHFYQIFPERFNNKTNGIVHRHWLLSANRGLSALIRELIGSDFETNPAALKGLLAFDDDPWVLDQVGRIKHRNKITLAKYIQHTTGIAVNPYSIFDMQAKRIHEYKRQLLNVLHVMHLYKTLKDNPNLDILPRTFVFAGKAAPGYYIAKEIIKLINVVAKTVNNDRTIKDKIKVVFLENYNVSVATNMIPAADVSQQISTTTKEASGTSNMKYMMNGAITLATLDGANIEIRDAVGDENIVLFGLKDYEVYEYYQKGNYDAGALYRGDSLLRETVDSLISGEFHVSQEEFRSLHDTLVKFGDPFFVLKDFSDYRRAQGDINRLYQDEKRWTAMSLRNTAVSGIFSADYTIQRYAEEIWNIRPLPQNKEE